MKKLILTVLLSGTAWLCYAQATNSGATGNDYAGGRFLGWNAMSGLLEFRTNNVNRMTIQNGPAGNNTDGRVAMGNNLGAFLPAARLHLYQFGGVGANGDMFQTDAINTVDNNWRMFTGPNPAGSIERFRLFVPANTSNAVLQTTQPGFMLFGTQNVLRAKFNPTISYGVNGFAAAGRNGYCLIGPNGTVTGGNLYDDTHGAFTILHLNGTGAAAQEFGYRPWMQTGITLTENLDRAYFGYRNLSGEANDLVMNWGDNSEGPGVGPDNMVFNFTTTNSAGMGVGNLADLAGSDLDGREIVRMKGSGNVGVGPRFDNANEPQSTLHQHQENAASSWFQITNQFTGTPAAPPYNTPTVIAATDGLRLGIIGNANTNINGHGLLYNQENKPLLFSTNANTNTVNANIATGTTLERVRIQSAGTPVYTFGFPGTYVISNPAAVGANLTRLGVSHNPAQPVYRPLTLMHIGYSAGVNNLGTLMDGWRPWMDIGTYTASRSDNVYVGLKNEDVDHYDAVIAWGRNQDSITQPSPEKLRFIFNTNYSAAAPPDNNPANDINGLEVGRFFAGKDTLGEYGRFGVGDFTVTGVNEEPTHKIDVIGNGRFRFLPDSIYMADDAVNKVVMVDEDGVLRWSNTVNADFGSSCADLAPDMLTDERILHMNNFDVHFGDNSSLALANNVGIGTTCADVLTSKLSVDNIAMPNGISVGTTTTGLVTNYGIRSIASNGSMNSIGIEGRAINAGPFFNYGVKGRARNSGQTSFGGDFLADSPTNSNVGVNAKATGGSANNYALQADANGGVNAYGLYATASAGSGINYGVYCSAPIDSVVSAAIYINGDIRGTGTDAYTSDVNLKQNIEDLENATEILSQLKPKTYEFNHSVHPPMHLPNGPQMGLIAQEVQSVLPHLVKPSAFPAQYDTMGNMTSPRYDYLSLSYSGLIPVLIAGFKEQQQVIVDLKQQNQTLNDRLTSLEQCVSALNLCNTSHSGMTPNTGENNVKNVELTDSPSIVLDQNVPNPFAEQTTIAYELTENVKRAQMLFYNAEGKLINSLELTERGKGQLNVFANDLSNGIYTYTLVVDGQIKGSKRMVKNK